jgi:hypothetical protein
VVVVAVLLLPTSRRPLLWLLPPLTVGLANQSPVEPLRLPLVQCR